MRFIIITVRCRYKSKGAGHVHTNTQMLQTLLLGQKKLYIQTCQHVPNTPTAQMHIFMHTNTHAKAFHTVSFWLPLWEIWKGPAPKGKDKNQDHRDTDTPRLRYDVIHSYLCWVLTDVPVYCVYFVHLSRIAWLVFYQKNLKCTFFGCTLSGCTLKQPLSCCGVLSIKWIDFSFDRF